MCIECYYKECPNHDKEEPFCYEEKCTATEEELKEYAIKRLEWLKSVESKSPI